ncbi:MAG TPA: NFACT family protein [Blastocatellia bacterium]|nr:NFACT family protein [Blastocatellia bacterium]
MDNFYLAAVVREMRPEIVGRTVARVYARDADLIIEFKPANTRALVASLDPSSPGMFLADPSRPDASSGQPPFALTLRKELAGARVLAIEKAAHDRIVRLELEAFSLAGTKRTVWLILMLTGRSANAVLTDSNGRIEAMFAKRRGLIAGAEMRWMTEQDELREYSPDSISIESGLTDEQSLGPDSLFGPVYRKELSARAMAADPGAALRSLLDDLFEKKPTPLVYSRLPLEQAGLRLLDLKRDLILAHIELAHARGMHRNEFASLSEAADRYYEVRAKARAFSDEFNATRKLLAREITKCEAAIRSIAADRARFEDFEKFKRYGDLILASLSTARVSGSLVSLVDYYDPQQPEIDIPIENGDTLQQAASRYFSRYQQAKRGLAAVAKREAEVGARLALLRGLAERLEGDVGAERLAEVVPRLRSHLGTDVEGKLKHRSADRAAEAGGAQIGRRFVTSDGYEIVVGRNDAENDRITFRIAKSNDVWLHTADYAGSHVIIRNPNREDVPQRSIHEAAELAAFYSQAKRDAKVAVHWTLRKFVSKPPRAKPGLVRLSSFKTLLVEPRCKMERLGNRAR